MLHHKSSRRHFLQGLGGITLAVPLLPSLMSRAEAQSVTAPKFFVSTWVGHGGVSAENTYPLDPHVTFTDTTIAPTDGVDPAHVIKSARLLDLKRTHAQTAAARAQVLEDLDNGMSRVSPLIGSFVSDALLAKMNLLRGIDFLDFGGHTRGYLGNFANNDGEGDPASATPTVDYAISQSPSFYAAGERALLKAPVVTVGGPQLSTFPSGSGVGRNPFSTHRVGELFDLLFAGVRTEPGQVDPRASLVDRVFADYSRTARGAFGPGRRISREDRGRLEEHMAGMQAIGDRMKALVTAGCTVPPTMPRDVRDEYARNGEADWEWTGNLRTPSERISDQRAVCELTNMLLVSAFSCGTTRMAVLNIPSLLEQWDPETFRTPTHTPTQRTDSHELVFHNHMLEDRQRHILLSQRFFFQHIYVDLLEKMSRAQVLPGVSILDRAVAYWGSESGPSTHNAKSIPTILVGDAGGFFNTGNYVDYTHRTRNIRGQYGNMWQHGVPQNQLLANIAQSMGLARNEYEIGGQPGYGAIRLDTTNNKVPYSPAMVAGMSAKLPII